jgi:hypothetical protein
MIDWLGYAASLAVLATFLMRSMRLLRVVAILSNVLFIAYGYIDDIQPIFLLHLALLPINLWRLIVCGNDASLQPSHRSAAHGRSALPPYALWFTAGLVAGLLVPLPILFLVSNSSEAKKLGLSFTVAPAISQAPTSHATSLLRQSFISGQNRPEH